MKNEKMNIYYTNYSSDTFNTLIKSDTSLHYSYSRFPDEWKRKLEDFMTGKKTLPMLYDATFKFIFDPSKNKERLADLISSIIGEEVEIVEVIPNESFFIEGKTLIIMDILVRLADGSIADVEIQKNPYDFSGERLACYTSDLILRQYSRLKSKHGKDFKYKDMRKVYSIVIYERTNEQFHEYPEVFLHSGKPYFKYELGMDLIQEYHIIALDIFKEFTYHKIYEDAENKKNDRLVGWLAFLVTESMDEAKKLVKIYPWLEEIYHEIAYYRNNIGGVIDMYSQMIAELDYNSINFIVDEQKAQIEAQKKLLDEKDAQLDEKDAQLDEKDAQLDELRKIIEELRSK